MPGRIPDALQQIFVASQRGEDVTKISAPRNGLAMRTHNHRNHGSPKVVKPGKKRAMAAPKNSKLSTDRSVGSAAADASRRAIKKKNAKKKVSL